MIMHITHAVGHDDLKGEPGDFFSDCTPAAPEWPDEATRLNDSTPSLKSFLTSPPRLLAALAALLTAAAAIAGLLYRRPFVG
jgi:hypothetical protein